VVAQITPEEERPFADSRICEVFVRYNWRGISR